MVFSRTNDLPKAAQAFKESLALRPNKIVEAELAKLSSRGFDIETASTCEAGTPACECVTEEANGEPKDDWKDLCKESPDVKPPLPGFHVYDARTAWGSATYLTDEHDQIVTQIGGDEHRMRSNSEYKLGKMDVKTVAGHKVLWIETTSNVESTYMSDTSLDTGENTVKNVTVCDVGDAKKPTKCLTDLVGAWRESSDTSELDPDTGETKGDSTSSSKEVVNDVTLGEDGVVTVKLVKGSSGEWLAQMLGPHVLWR
jgi:mRNA-degrading endonuclease HigB of HigAB toxin-antitoxin module